VKIVLDTNVLISGIFFSGPPFEILKAWRNGKVKFVLSPEILYEYYRVANLLKEQFPNTDVEPILNMIAINSELTQAPALSEQVCEDKNDDKFLACALAGNTDMIVSGDKHLLKLSGYRGITIIKPAKFVDEYLRETL
jgi:putative PIN family toxin of toxin-antitoxin system